MTEYEINEATQVIRPCGKDAAIVCEEDAEYEVSDTTNNIIKYNCVFYGSSYAGRCEGTKALTGLKTKYPIIIEESRKIIFFPTSSVRTQESIWLSFNQIKDIERYGKGSKVIFNNGKSMVLPISYYLLNNQYYRASLLKTKLYERIKEM